MTILIVVALLGIVSLLMLYKFSKPGPDSPIVTASMILSAASAAALLMGFLSLGAARLEQSRVIGVYERLSPFAHRINIADRPHDVEHGILVEFMVQLVQKDISYVNECIRSARDNNSGVFDIWFSDELAELDEIVLLE
jgi:hypothetical protein